MKKITGKIIVSFCPARWMSALLVLLFFAQCKDGSEGCLDIYATNFSISADKTCEECCKYPALSLGFSHMVDSLTYNPESVYLNNDGAEYQIGQFSWYISDLRLIGTMLDANEYGTTVANIIDTTFTLQVHNSEGADIEVHNFTRVARTSTSANMGVLKVTGQTDSIHFFVGVSIPADSLAHSEFGTIRQQVEFFRGRRFYIEQDTSLLTPGADTTDCSQIIQDTIDMDPVRLCIKSDTVDRTDMEVISLGNEMLIYQPITLPFVLEIEKSTNYRIPLEIDYGKWFSGINHATDITNQQIFNIIRDSLPGSIKIKE